MGRRAKVAVSTGALYRRPVIHRVLSRSLAVTVVLGVTGVVAGCASRAVSPRANAEALRRSGEPAGAYDAYAQWLCAGEADLAAAGAFVELWDELGRGGDPMLRLERCSVPPVQHHYASGLVAAIRGDFARADAALAAAQSAAADHELGDVVYRRGLVALRAERAADAVAHLARAVAYQPSRVEPRLALAQALVGGGDFSAAVDSLRGLLAISPGGPDLERARRILRAAVRGSVPPLEPAAEVVVQELLGALERGQVGEEHATRARELLDEVRHPHTLTAVGMIALRLGDLARGAALLQEAAQASPLDADPSRVLGASHYAADRPSLALAPLRAAAARDPFDAATQQALADCAIKLGQIEVALGAYRALAVLQPRTADHFLWLARLERRLGHLPAARLAVERGHAVEPQHVPLLVERASIEAQLVLLAESARERDQAEERARAAVADLLAVAPQHPGAEAILASLERRK